MTLYEFLVDQMTTQVKMAIDNFGNNNEFHKHIGRAEMCDELIKMLSDDTLKMEVITRHERLRNDPKQI